MAQRSHGPGPSNDRSPGVISILLLVALAVGIITITGWARGMRALSDALSWAGGR